MERKETPHPKVNELVTGHFHAVKGYQGWREHGTNDWLLIYTVSGKGRFGYRTGEFIAQPGDMVLLKPATLHDYGVEKTLQRWELLWTHFHPRPAWLEWLDWPEVAPGLLHLAIGEASTRRKIVARFRDVHRLATSPLRRPETFAMNALEEVLLWCDAQNPKSQQSRADPRVRAVMEYICGNLSENINLEVLASAGKMSISRLAHLFREQTGTTPRQFLEQQRLNRAIQLIESTPFAIKEIAFQTGFANPFYFTLRFKRQTGLSPRQYRQRRLAACRKA